MHRVYTRHPCVLRGREHEKRPAGGRDENADVQRKPIRYILIQDSLRDVVDFKPQGCRKLRRVNAEHVFLLFM